LIFHIACIAKRYAIPMSKIIEAEYYLDKKNSDNIIVGVII